MMTLGLLCAAIVCALRGIRICQILMGTRPDAQIEAQAAKDSPGAAFFALALCLAGFLAATVAVGG